MKNYRIEFTPLNGGTLQIKGGIISTIFVPYIRRQVGWVYVNKDLSFLEDLDTKEDSFSKNTAFNKDFGTASGDVLEGNTRTINTGEITKLSNTSGTNTGDETTASIQTKRPIKTVNGVTLEGSGNIPISGTVEPLPICVLTSTNSTLTASQSTPAILPWDVETEKDTGFTHNNSTNNTRLEVDSDGTYQIQANIRMFSSQQRAQFVGRYLINGVIQTMPMGSSYVRNNGTSSDFWTCIINPPPVKLTAGQYIEVQIQVEAQATTTITGQFRGSDRTFSITKLQGVNGEAGPTGSGANIILQKERNNKLQLLNNLNPHRNMGVFWFKTNNTYPNMNISGY